jgi:hypothetical protein
MTPITLKNRVNGERFICENIRNITVIDGVEYLTVTRKNNPRTLLIRKDVLEKESKLTSS